MYASSSWSTSSMCAAEAEADDGAESEEKGVKEAEEVLAGKWEEEGARGNASPEEEV